MGGEDEEESAEIEEGDEEMETCRKYFKHRAYEINCRYYLPP